MEKDDREKIKAKAGYKYDFFVNVKSGELMMRPHRFEQLPPMKCVGKVRDASHHEFGLKMY